MQHCAVPFDRPRTIGTPGSHELDRLAAAQAGRSHDQVVDASLEWATARLLDGTDPVELSDVAWSHAIVHGDLRALAATPAYRQVALGAGSPSAALAAVHPVVRAVTSAARSLAERGSIATDPEPAEAASPPPGSGPPEHGWSAFDLQLDEDPVEELVEAALRGGLVPRDPRWFAAAAVDPDHAEESLLAVGALGYHLDEQKLIVPTQLRLRLGDRPCDAAVFAPVVALIGGPVQDPDGAAARRRTAEELALDALERAPEDFGRLPRGGHERVSTVATGLARTPIETRDELLLASLEEGLAPEDLVEAVSLLAACGYAGTSFDGDTHRRALHACTGAEAVQLCLDRAHSPGLRYELALCAIHAPAADLLDPVGELWVPPADDGGLEDLCGALEDGDPDGAAEAATAVLLDDPATVDAAWRAVHDLAITDQWGELHPLQHTVAMERCFRASGHPARVWYLAAAARTAGHAAALDQDLTRRALDLLG